MNSRERLLRVLDGKTIDRVPISTYELCGYNSLAFENKEPSYKTLMDYIREKTDCIAMWNPSSNENIALSAHALEISTECYRQDNCSITKQVIYAPKGNISRTVKTFDNVYTNWTTEHLCKNIDDVDAYLSIPYKGVSYDYKDYERIRGEVGDGGIIMASVSDPVCIAMEIMEFGQATVWAITETDHFQRTLETLYERIMENLKIMLEGGVVDLYRIVGPEYMTPPYMHPNYFKRFVYPYVEKMTRLIQSYGGRVRIHSHGRIGKVLDIIKDIGADAIDPCEGPPDGDISLGEVKKRLGHDMCIFGNIQLKLLENGTTDEVRQYVKYCMDAGKDGGRYVIMPTASPINVPLYPRTEDNYRTFIRTALEFGRY